MRALPYGVVFDWMQDRACEGTYRWLIFRTIPIWKKGIRVVDFRIQFPFMDWFFFSEGEEEDKLDELEDMLFDEDDEGDFWDWLETDL